MQARNTNCQTLEDQLEDARQYSQALVDKLLAKQAELDSDAKEATAVKASMAAEHKRAVEVSQHST